MQQPDQPEQPPKRGRGRPRKERDPIEKKPPGRPKKYATPEEAAAAKRATDLAWKRERYNSDPEFRERVRVASKAAYSKKSGS